MINQDSFYHAQQKIASDKYLYDENNHEEVLCTHCKRTQNNGIRCLGICVADSDY